MTTTALTFDFAWQILNDPAFVGWVRANKLQSITLAPVDAPADLIDVTPRPGPEIESDPLNPFRRSFTQKFVRATPPSPKRTLLQSWATAEDLFCKCENMFPNLLLLSEEDYTPTHCQFCKAELPDPEVLKAGRIRFNAEVAEAKRAKM